MPGRSYLSGTKAKENFTGHERDAETGMLYAGARYYMPNIGRWTSVDPLAGKFPSYSPYNYVANNPLSYVDPDGREFLSTWDQQIADKTKDLMQKRAAFAELKQMQSNQAERMAAQDGNSTLATLASREAAEYGAIADNLRTGIGMLTELGETRDMVFTFRMSIDGQGYVRGRQRLDGRPELSLFGSSWGHLVHEAVHAYQYLTEGSKSGAMFFPGPGSKLSYRDQDYTVASEVAAYRMQYAFAPSSLTVNNPNSISRITDKWLCRFSGNPYQAPCH